MNRAAASRLAGENRARLQLLRVICAVSVWRTVMTRLLPLCGTAAWWTALICLLPGAAAAGACRGMMHFTHTDTLEEAVRACWGRPGVWLAAGVAGGCLMLDAAASLTALITLFTQGLGTRGTQITLAVLTGAVLLVSLHREGLARAAQLLTGVLLAGLAVFLLLVWPMVRIDCAFPLWGEGTAGVAEACRAGFSLAWPLCLLLTVPPSTDRGRLQAGIAPVFLACGLVLLTLMTIPQEQLIHRRTLAALLMLPFGAGANAVRLLGMCLLLTTFFLAIAGCVQQAGMKLQLPGWEKSWLPYALLGAVLLTQTAEIAGFWRLLGKLEPWLILPWLLMGVPGLLIAYIRRNRV